LNTIREDRTPNLLLMRYALATWEVRDLLLIPSFMFSVRHFPTQRRQDAKTPRRKVSEILSWRLRAFAPLR
jgi:hypothetical protein